MGDESRPLISRTRYREHNGSEELNLDRHSNVNQSDLNQNEESGEDEESDEDSQIPSYVKLLSLFTTLLLAFGSHYSAHALGTLKQQLKQNLNITNGQYGSLQSTVALVNTILPLIGGILVDKFGSGLGSLSATTLVTLGSVLVGLSTNLKSFKWMVVGRFIYGIGSGTIVVIQGSIIANLFHGSGLSLAMGLKIITSRVASFLAMSTVIPIVNATGFYGYALWVAAGLCLISLLFNLLYLFALKLTTNYTPQSQQKDNKKFHINQLLKLPLLNWLFILISATLGAGLNTFLHFHVELLQIRFNLTEEQAGYWASTTQILPLLLPPIIGWLVGKFGGRIYLALFSTISFTLSMYLLGQTQFHPLSGLIFYSLALSIGPLTLLTSLSILLPNYNIGTGLGLYKSGMNVSASILDIIVGRLQHSNSNNGFLLMKAKGEYDQVMSFMLLIGIISIIVMSFIFIIDQSKFNGKLNQSDDSLNNQQEEDDEEPDDRTKFINKIAFTLFSIAMLASWIIFIISFF